MFTVRSAYVHRAIIAYSFAPSAPLRSRSLFTKRLTSAHSEIVQRSFIFTVIRNSEQISLECYNLVQRMNIFTPLILQRLMKTRWPGRLHRFETRHWIRIFKTKAINQPKRFSYMYKCEYQMFVSVWKDYLTSFFDK